MTDEQLKSYLGAVERVRQERAGALDAATRRQIAIELGMGDADLAAARAAGEADLTRGIHFIGNRLWDDAVRSLEEADALLPDDLRVLGALSRALLGRRRGGDLVRARGLARHCLEIDPRHAPAYALLRALNWQPTWRKSLVAGAVLALVGAGVVAATVTARRSTNPASSTRCPDRQQYCDVPVVLEPGNGLEELALTPAVLHVTPKDARLDIGGKLSHAGSVELERLEVQIALFDVVGRRIGGYAFDAMPAFMPPLRPGDAHAFYESTLVPAETVRAEISAGARQTSPAPSSYGEGKLIPLRFEPAAPEHFKLRATWRSRNLRFYQDKSTVEGVIEVVNAGEATIRQLDIAMRGLDASGAQVGDRSHETVAYPHMPPMAAGERRAYRAFLYVTGRVATEELIVTQVQ